jgi:hypothetical protein
MDPDVKRSVDEAMELMMKPSRREKQKLADSKYERPSRDFIEESKVAAAEDSLDWLQRAL